MSIINRMKAPMPKFFRRLRNIGIMMAAIGGAIISAPVSLPAAVISIGSYLTLAGSIIGTISQATVQGEGSNEPAYKKGKGK